ncbi:protein phosphatase 2C containing protein (macronuclear) [Tetrahymena thermophila SB210]|uniref:Protein phosphatase 2C containing protein n=1 Tax=Tetrahymena thermophila (strain SB210) TaxID=312017 RepID=I7MB13_TETTS|nr:protein phosphatase 2C containing protein [Tetrahymena thermophila SB210]EAS07106.2 protein phosphatase 2C containing protein [Tetrahymena thermophila SB210]|eukprot:XP_001027348.2 protein phosphatase 2C containing protein [Tetrahymena thermophila SB210]
MFLMNMFGSNNSYKNKKKKGKKKKIETTALAKNQVNPLKDVKMFGAFKMGYGPKKTECQDSHCIMEKFIDECHFFAVYDGHGSSGKEASQAANDYIQTYLEKNNKKIKGLTTDKTREQFLRAAFKSAESKLKSSGIDYSNSGTCSIAIFIQKNICYIANLGDSRAVLFRQTNKEKLAIELSYDHKPTRPDERERIIRSGGKIEKLIHDGVPVGPYRVWADDEGPGIAMTRTLGDLQAKKIGLISEPEIQRIELTRQDKFIVIGSDGVWDVMSSAEVVGFVLQYQPPAQNEKFDKNDKDNANQENVASALVAECRARWDDMNKNKKNSSKIGDLPYLKFGCDDITCVVAYLEFNDDDAPK